jgi:hypothetical protein
MAYIARHKTTRINRQPRVEHVEPLPAAQRPAVITIGQKAVASAQRSPRLARRSPQYAPAEPHPKPLELVHDEYQKASGDFFEDNERKTRLEDYLDTYAGNHPAETAAVTTEPLLIEKAPGRLAQARVRLQNAWARAGVAVTNGMTKISEHLQPSEQVRRHTLRRAFTIFAGVAATALVSYEAADLVASHIHHAASLTDVLPKGAGAHESFTAVHQPVETIPHTPTQPRNIVLPEYVPGTDRGTLYGVAHDVLGPHAGSEQVSQEVQRLEALNNIRNEQAAEQLPAGLHVRVN